MVRGRRDRHWKHPGDARPMGCLREVRGLLLAYARSAKSRYLLAAYAVVGEY